MVATALVEDRLDGGRSLLLHLVSQGFDVTAAAWLKTSEEGDWLLYIASRVVDESGLAEAFRKVHFALQNLPALAVSMSEVKLVGASTAVAADLLSIRGRREAETAWRYTGQRVGDIPIDDAWIYPASFARWEILAQGKEPVLQRLEQESLGRIGKPGEYVLARDERGNLVAFIAGHSFVGSGTLNVGGNRITVVDGLVVKAEPA